jgi:hypothetical protein
MADDEELEELEEPDDPDAVDLEALEDEDILEDDALEDDALEDDTLEDETLDVVEPEEDVGETAAVPVVAEEEEDEEDEDDVIDPDDVEAGLDVILKDRLVAIDEEDEDEDEETPETDERGDASTKVLPKRPGEFTCQSCFLVKHPSQLADSVRMLCRDCV